MQVWRNGIRSRLRICPVRGVGSSPTTCTVAVVQVAEHQIVALKVEASIASRHLYGRVVELVYTWDLSSHAFKD